MNSEMKTTSTDEEEKSEDPESGQKYKSKDADEKFCTSCGERIKEDAVICPECGVNQGHGQEGTKEPGIAALASVIITGAGQIYNGQIGKGIGLMVLQVVNVALMFVLIGFVTLPLTWAYSVYDAYKTSKRINNGDITV
ncbi:MAG: hypothetical protein ABEK59_09820 [Halobacteria archaeon]